MPGGNPLIEEPGDSPTLPLITLPPVFVTVELAKTPNVAAAPSGTADCAKEHAADRSNTLKALRGLL